ncbi:MAG TPA: hypothetical protein ENK11_04405 [Phycisphaerales bacterium]|nr:hypothetical protein [Phycisphaerales bacterium]
MKKTVILMLCVLIAGCQQKPQEASAPEPPPIVEWDTFAQATLPDVWIGGQPSDDALSAFVEKGGTTVINLRTDEEMAFYPYYGRALAARGLKYVRIPTSGQDLDGSKYASLAEALKGHEGSVMLHCRSGKRATYLWAMRRIAEEGLTAEQAVKWCDDRLGKPWAEGAEILYKFASEQPG